MRSRIVASLFAAAVAAALPACHAGASESAEPLSARETQRLLVETPWLDHLPAHEADPIELLQFDRRAHGVYVHGSAYRGSYDVFRYEATRDELRMTFLDDGAKAKTRYRIERLKRGGFDLRLTFTDSPRGPSAYYGFENRRELPAAVRAVLPIAGAR